MVNSFKSANLNSNKASTTHVTLETIEQLLQLHGYETGDLIHQYYIERNREQNKMTDNPYGLLTVRCSFKEHNLQVSVSRVTCPLQSIRPNHFRLFL